MTKEELKEIIFSHVNLDSYRRASIEKFFEETDDLTVDNYMEKYQEWVNSGKSKKALEQVHNEIMDEYDSKIKIGIKAIPNNNYTPYNDPDSLQRFKFDRVRCNTTGLKGLISDDGNEVVPCIFESINIHLDGFIEAEFKGLKCDLMTVNREIAERRKDRSDILLYGKTGALSIDLYGHPFSKQLLNLLSNK